MHNFGRGMWRRISDYDKQQQTSYLLSTDIQANRLLHYFQTQKQRAEKKEVKEEISITDISINNESDNYVFVEKIDEELVISEEPSVLSEEPSVLNEEPSISSEEPSVLSEEPSISKEEPSVLSEEPSISKEEPSISSEEPSILSEEPSVVVSEAPSILSEEPVISKSSAKKRRKK
jgi:hypothetical protein